MKEKILLFIPAYNCEKQIIRVLSQVTDKALEYISGVIVVNNRSTDGTEEAVLDFIGENWDKNIKLLRNDENYGLGGSHKVAFKYAIDNGYDYVIVLHGDDQGRLNDILPVLKRGIHHGYDCVLGARFMLGSKLIGYSLFRTIGNIVYDFIFAAALKMRVFDLGSGLNIYSTEMLREKFYEKFPDNLMFNYCMVMASAYYSHKVRFYPISWRETDQVSNVKMGKQAVKVLKMLFDYVMDNESIKADYRDKEIEEYTAQEILAK